MDFHLPDLIQYKFSILIVGLKFCGLWKELIFDHKNTSIASPLPHYFFTTALAYINETNSTSMPFH